MIIYTRFNCKHFLLEENTSKLSVDKRRAVRRMQARRFDEKWLNERLALFETFTYPSVVAQTDQHFKWVGLVHKDSSQWFFDSLLAFPRMTVESVDFDVEAAIRGEASINLDSDDAISRDFVSEANGVKFEGETLFVRGIRHRVMTNAWYATNCPTGHFNIVYHPELTVLDFPHGRSKKLPHNLVDHKRPMWLEVIHEDNIANKLKKAKSSVDVGREFAQRYFEIG